jgi:phage baseplate assembly protein V
MSESLAAIERLYRRIMLMIGRGRIKISKDDGPTQSHQVRLGKFETFDDIPRLSEYGFNSMPPGESDAVLVFMGGNRMDGVIVATGNQTYRMRSLKPGEVSISDNLGQSVYLTQAGIIVNGGGLPVLVTNTPSVTLDTPMVHMTGDAAIDGNLHVTKNVTVDQNVVAVGDISDHSNKSMATMRQVYNGHTHAVNNVQGGSGSVTSNQPGQQE